MPLFAIAYVYDDFPRHDRVEHVRDRQRYFDKGILVHEEITPHWHTVKSPHIGLEFIKAETSNDAYHLFIERFPKHVFATTIASVPRKS